jgi:hypothetical protein
MHRFRKARCPISPSVLSSSNLRDRKLAKFVASTSAEGGMLCFIRRNESLPSFTLKAYQEVTYPPARPAFPGIPARAARQ